MSGWVIIKERLVKSEGRHLRIHTKRGPPGGLPCVLPHCLCQRGPRCCMGGGGPQRDRRTSPRPAPARGLMGHRTSWFPLP